MKSDVSILAAISRPLFGASLLVLFVAMALPSTTLSWIRHACHPLGSAMEWLEQRTTVFDMDHVVFFAALAFAWTILIPALRRWHAVLRLSLTLAVATELMQFMVPGRIPRISDVRDDLIGAILGWALALGLLWLARSVGEGRSRRNSPDAP